MLKSIRKTAATVAENVGILPVSIEEATKAAEQRRQDLVVAQAAVSEVEDELNALHERGADAKELAACEAKLADGKLSAERAQRAYHAADRRLATAKEAEASKARVAAIAKRDRALKVRAEAAAEIDRLAAEMAEQVKRFDDTLVDLAEARAAGAAGNHSPSYGRNLVAEAIEEAGITPRATWTGKRRGAVERAAHDADCLQMI